MSIFSLKLSLRWETVLNSIKTLKSLYKATLDEFFKKKTNDDKIKFVYMTDFLC